MSKVGLGRYGGAGDGFFLKTKSPAFPFGLGVPPLFLDLRLAHQVILLATVVYPDV